MRRWYIHETRTGHCYVKAMSRIEPSALLLEQLQASLEETSPLAVVEIDVPEPPEGGHWQISNGMLVECPGDEVASERRRQRLAARRDHAVAQAPSIDAEHVLARERTRRS